jgi:hypothetical protein
MQLNLIEKPSDEIITLEETKNYLRIDHNFDDNLILCLIKSTREAMESIIQKSIMKQTWEYTFDRNSICEFDFGKSDHPSIFGNTLRILLPKPPIIRIVSVKINNRTINPQKYSLEKVNDKFCLCVSDRGVFSDGRKISMAIIYEAGVADRVENVPYQLKLANFMLAANAYRERFSCSSGGNISKGVRQLLDPFLNLRVF